MPLGLRTMNKIERIVREEMDAAGAQELRMPIVLPAEPWRATGRYAAYGDLMFRMRDRHEREFVLGPTQEEVVAELAQQELPSYRDLPANVYQGGVEVPRRVPPALRAPARQGVPDEGRVLDRPGRGRDARLVPGDVRRVREGVRPARPRLRDRRGRPRQIGGGENHEFMAIADVGEDLFVRCENGDYLADTEAATPRPPEPA